MKMQQNVKQFLAQEIKKIGLLPVDVSVNSYDEDFLVSGMIDSFGFISLITSAEAQFSIEITEDAQLDDRIRSINGFAEMICEILLEE